MLKAETAMESGTAITKRWVLEFEPGTPGETGPPTGWTSSPDPRGHVRMRFATRDETVDFAERHGLNHRVAQPKERVIRPIPTPTIQATMATDASVAEPQSSIACNDRRNGGAQHMTSNTIPFPRQNASAQHEERLSDGEIAKMIDRAVGAVQKAMDEAVLAGLIVEPSFSQIDIRETPRGVVLGSFVCEARCYRRPS